MLELASFPTTLPEFNEVFATETACQEYLFQVRWPQGWRCPRCGAPRGWRNGRGDVECAACGYQASLTAGTVFHGTKKPLRQWFQVIYLMMAPKNGMSATTVARTLGVSYPTAWTWLQKLRTSVAARPHTRLQGTVQVDDAYLGGYRPGLPGRRQGGGNKDLLLVAVEERGAGAGRVRLAMAAAHTQADFTALVQAHVAPGSTVRTDGLSSYDELREKGYDHQPTVIGQPQERALELFPHVHRVISLLKRWLLGTHQGAVETKYLPRYLEEFEFRFNRRGAAHRTLLFQRLLETAMHTRAQPYWRLIGRSAPHQPLAVGAT